MSQTNQLFSSTFAIIALGYALKRMNIVSEKDGKVLSKLLMHSTFPALLFLSFMRVPLKKELFLLPLLAVLVGSVMLVLAWFVVKNYQNSQRGVLMMGVGAFNTGLFGFPIFEGLFGKEGLNEAIMFDIGVTAMNFGVLYPLAAYFSTAKSEGFGKQEIIKKVFSSPPFLATLLGLAVNVSGFQMPEVLIQTLEPLARGNKAIVLLLIGIYLSFELDRKQRFSIYKVLSVRYLVGILAAILLYYFLPDDESSRKKVLMLCVLLPIGMTILPFSDEMNLDSRLAGTLLNTSLVLSFLLMWATMILI